MHHPSSAVSLSLVAALVSLGACTDELPWPPRAPCVAAPGPPVRTVTFPPRDFACRPGVEPPCELALPLRAMEQRTVDVSEELSGSTFVYVVSALALPEPTRRPGEPRRSIGADLDGMDSGEGSMAATATCEEFGVDLVSSLEPGVVGIDNAFSSLVPSAESGLRAAECPESSTEGCLDALLARDIREGRLLLLIEVGGVDSFEHDPEVEVAMYAARLADGDGPALVGETLAPGQRFATAATLATPAAGSILHGRLFTGWPTLDLPRERFGYPDRLERVQLRAAICAEGLFHASLAAVTPVDALVEQAAPTFASSLSEERLRRVFETVADVSPSAGDSTLCERVSLAYRVEAVAAERTE